MVVRDATIADAPALSPLLGELGYPASTDALALRMQRMLGRDDQRVLVAERARGLGVGRALIERAEAVGKSLGASRLMVTTHVRRADAHAFYERLGFEFTGRRYVRAIR